jgi:hypothetical protein
MTRRSAICVFSRYKETTRIPPQAFASGERFVGTTGLRRLKSARRDCAASKSNPTPLGARSVRPQESSAMNEAFGAVAR